MNCRSSISWLTILLGLFAIIGFALTPALADVDSEGNFFEDPVVEPEDPGQALEVFEADEEFPFEESFGSRVQSTFIPASDFEPVNGGDSVHPSTTWREINRAWRYATSRDGIFAIPVRLPSGARILKVRWYLYDSSTSSNISVLFTRESFPSGRNTLLSGTPLSSGAFMVVGRPNHRVTNANKWYQVRIDLNTGLGNIHRFWGS